MRAAPVDDEGTSPAEWYAAYGTLPSRAAGTPAPSNNTWSLARLVHPGSARLRRPQRPGQRRGAAPASGTPEPPPRDANPVEGHHAADRPAFGGTQPGDEVARAERVQRAVAAPGLLGAERDEPDGEGARLLPGHPGDLGHHHES